MVRKGIAVKKFIVRPSGEEREQLSYLVRSGKRPAQLLTKARILSKTDVSEFGEGWSDRRIVEALDTSIANIERTRRQLVIQPVVRPVAAGRRTIGHLTGKSVV